jgi:hypothetical protein
MSEESELVAVRVERYDLFLDMSFRDLRFNGKLLSSLLQLVIL